MSHTPLLGKLSQIMIVPANRYCSRPVDDTKRTPFGSGPYRLAARYGDREYLLEAVPDHWHFRRLFRRVRVLVEPDDAARAELLAQGRADGLRARTRPDPGPPRRRTLHRPGLAGAAPGLSRTHLPRAARRRPDQSFRDVAVRRAVSMALDRTRLTTGPLEHMGEPAVQVVSRSVFGYTPPTPHTPATTRHGPAPCCAKLVFPARTHRTPLPQRQVLPRP